MFTLFWVFSIFLIKVLFFCAFVLLKFDVFLFCFICETLKTISRRPFVKFQLHLGLRFWFRCGFRFSFAIVALWVMSRSCLGNRAGIALGAQAALLYALKVLQLCRCRCVRSMSAATSCAGRCRSRSPRTVGYARVRLMLRLLLLLVLVCMMMLVMVQRSARSIVADLLGQRLTAPTQSGAQIIGDFCLGQQLLEDL